MAGTDEEGELAGRGASAESGLGSDLLRCGRQLDAGYLVQSEPGSHCRSVP